MEILNSNLPEDVKAFMMARMHTRRELVRVALLENCGLDLEEEPTIRVSMITSFDPPMFRSVTRL